MTTPKLLLIALAFFCLPGFAQEEEGEEAIAEATNLTQFDRIRAVSRKIFLKRERYALNVFAGSSINDAFFTRYSIGGRAAYHIVDSLAVELGGSYMITLQNGETLRIPREQLNAITADASPFGYVDLGMTFSPMYGKIAVFNDWILHFDGFVSGGVGAIFDTGEDLAHPAMEVGLGVRVFVLDWLVVRGDVRDYAYPQDTAKLSNLQTLLMANVGVEFYFPLGFEYRNLASKVVD